MVIDRAYKNTPGKYHGYILLLEQNQKVANSTFELSQDLKNMGVFSYNNKTYVKTHAPYTAVDGRVQMAVDEAVENREQIDVGEPKFEIVSEQVLCTIKVTTARGVSYGTAKVGIGGNGVDAQNPFENAQTSALGRGLAMQGYGLIGTGLTSAEEMKAREQEENGDMSITPTPSSETGQKKHETPQQPQGQQQGNAQQNASQKTGQSRGVQSNIKQLGSYQFVLHDAKLDQKNGKPIWKIAAVTNNGETKTLFANAESVKLDDFKQGDKIQVDVAQSGSALLATSIQLAQAVS